MNPARITTSQVSSGRQKMKSIYQCLRPAAEIPPLYKVGRSRLFHCDVEKLNIVATYNLLYNGSLMVDEGMGYAICFDKIINVSGESSLCFRPLAPQTEAGMSLVWKKYQVFTKAAEKFLLVCREMLPSLHSHIL